MLVCSCHTVWESKVREVVASGAACVDAVGAACDAGTDCGVCVSHIEELLEEFDRRLDVQLGGTTAA